MRNLTGRRVEWDILRVIARDGGCSAVEWYRVRETYPGLELYALSSIHRGFVLAEERGCLRGYLDEGGCLTVVGLSKKGRARLKRQTLLYLPEGQRRLATAIDVTLELIGVALELLLSS